MSEPRAIVPVAVCQVCVEGHQHRVGQACKDCPGSGVALAGVATAILLVGIGLCFLHEQTEPRLAKFSGSLRRLVHQTRSALLSTGFVAKVKLAVTFAQIVSTLDTIYSLKLSPDWFEWTAPMRFWGDIDVIAWFLPSECVSKNVVEKLLLRALVPLAVLLGMPLLGVIQEVVRMKFSRSESTPDGRTQRNCIAPPTRRSLKFIGGRPSTEEPKTRYQAVVAGALSYTPASLILSFAFTPSVSTRIFESWFCLSFNYDYDVTYSYLATDLAVRCEGNDQYDKLISMAWVLIAIWPVGMVAMYAALLFPCRKHLQEQSMDAPLVRATEFLHRDFTARCFWWEIVSLMQRTTLSGWLLLVEREPKVFRLLLALIISISFLILLLALQPYKRKLDNAMAIGCQILFVCLFLAGLLVRLYELILSDPQGSENMAARFLGVHSVDELVVLMILVCMIMLALLVFTVGHEAYSSFIQQRLEKKWSVCTMDPPYVHWKPKEIYACFLSHYKMEAASDARYMHDMLRKMLRAPVFLDSSVLSDLRHLITEGVHKSDAVLLLFTKGVLSRPWCLLELLESARRGIPVVIVQVEQHSISMSEAHEFLDNFESEMRRINPAGLEFLYKRIGNNLDELLSAVRVILRVNQRNPITFCSNAGDHAIVATMKDVIEQMARATGRRLLWKSTSDSSGAAHKGLRRMVLRSKWLSLHSVSVGAKLVARRLSRSSSHSHGHNVVNIGGTVFFCCAREDALNYARMIRAQLHHNLGRPCAIGGGPKTARFLDECQLVVVLLTKRLLTDATALFEVWKALQLDVRMVTVCVAGGGYDFDDASKVFLDFDAAMDRAGARKDLEMRLPHGVSIEQMGKNLHDSLTALIALSWTPNGSDNHSHALADALVSRLPKKKCAVSRQQSENGSRSRFGGALGQLGTSRMGTSSSSASRNWDVCQQV